ncbi:MAG: ribosomal protein S18-alanine N-acetyltransferase [Bryobacteraceae bacterium]
MVEILIRAAKRKDAEQLVAIEQQSFSDPNWKASEFFKYNTTVAEVEGRIAGFLVSRQNFAGDATSLPECEILNLAVAPTFRRMGIGSALLSQELRTAADFFLEVRESNLAAQALYRRFGFIEAGRRAGYYRFPTETAIVMKMKKC